MLHYALHRLLTLPDKHSPCQNPVVVWGASGTGKSMLMHSLSDHWARRQLTHRVVRVHAADWARGCDIECTPQDDGTTSQTDPSGAATALSAAAPRAPATTAWFDPHISTALFVDDVHQLVGRHGAQLRLATAIDDISQAGGLVFVTCRVHPAAMSGLQAQLVSRLLGGLSMELHAPGPEARAVIVQRFAKAAGWLLSHDAAAYAAGRIDGSVRELRQSLSRCLPVRPLSQQPIDTADLQERLAARCPDGITPQDVLRIVGRQFGVTVAKQKSSSRRRNVVLARSVAMYLLRKNTHLPLKQIGNLFGGRDHTTVIHACRKIEQQLAAEPELSRFVRETTTNLRLRNSAPIA